MAYRRGGGGAGGGLGGFGGFGAYNLELTHEPSELYPKIAVPEQTPISDFERQIVGQFLALREAIRDGPLSTGSSNDKGRVVVEVEGINDGIKRYSDRYIRKRKIGRSVDEHPYVTRFFPEELHATMGIRKGKKQKKGLQISKFTRELINAEKEIKSEGAEEAAEGEGGDKKAVIERLAQAEAEGASEDGEEEEEVDMDDDDFDEDEDDDGDYNAEQYFDNGDEYGDDDDGGDDEAAF